MPKSKNAIFESSIFMFTEHHVRPTTRTKKILDAHPDNDCIWKNTDPCNISLDDTRESEEPVNAIMTTTSIRSEDNFNMTQESIGSTAISMSEEDNETCYNTNEEYDSWHNAIETMDNY